MNRLKKIPFFAFVIVFCANSLVHAVTDSTKFGLGINFVPIFSGTPELQLDYFPLKSWGVTSSFGHTYKTKRGGWIAVGDNAEIHDLTGNFFKVGLKYRTPSRRGGSFLGFGQLSYVFSQFNETGKRSTSLANAEVVNFKGFVNGVALAFGLEFRLVSIVHFRAGIQFGIYGQRKHLGYPGHTLQPGFGASGQILNDQFIIALACKFGQILKR